jgi:GTP-binding protein
MSGFGRTRYLLSAHTARQAPPDRGAEVAFAGRSNAGKSSALNAITGIGSLARTSKTPGRTQALNFFAVDADEARRLVDLPGYGYARVPATVKRHWQETLADYFRARRSLRGLVLVMDIRHPLTEFDLQLLEWCHTAGLAVHVLLTKADKLNRGPATATLQRVRSALRARYGAADAQIFSATKRLGVEEAQAVLERWLAPAEPEPS